MPSKTLRSLGRIRDVVALTAAAACGTALSAPPTTALSIADMVAGFLYPMLTLGDRTITR